MRGRLHSKGIKKPAVVLTCVAVVFALMPLIPFPGMAAEQKV